MTKETLNKLMKTYCIVPSELDDIIPFVADLLYLEARELEEKEPYAIRTIGSLYDASRQVDSMIDYISEIEENEQ
jgi:hypothetical protein